MVDHNAVREHTGCIDDVNRVIRRVILKDRMHDAVGVIPKRWRNDQALRDKADLVTTIISGLHDLNAHIFDGSFRQVGTDSQNI